MCDCRTQTSFVSERPAWGDWFKDGFLFLHWSTCFTLTQSGETEISFNFLEQWNYYSPHSSSCFWTEVLRWETWQSFVFMIAHILAVNCFTVFYPIIPSLSNWVIWHFHLLFTIYLASLYFQMWWNIPQISRRTWNARQFGRHQRALRDVCLC